MLIIDVLQPAQNEFPQYSLIQCIYDINLFLNKIQNSFSKEELIEITVDSLHLNNFEIPSNVITIIDALYTASGCDVPAKIRKDYSVSDILTGNICEFGCSIGNDKIIRFYEDLNEEDTLQLYAKTSYDKLTQIDSRVKEIDLPEFLRETLKSWLLMRAARKYGNNNDIVLYQDDYQLAYKLALDNTINRREQIGDWSQY